jgi:hypothetical protein
MNFLGKSAGIAALVAGLMLPSNAGPFSAGLNDPSNPHDAPVPGFLGPHGIGKARLFAGLDESNEPFYENPENFVNPLFFAWAASATDYRRADGGTSFSNPDLALGPVTGDAFLVVSLGDLTSSQITAGAAPGSITLELARPVHDLSGADFVVFENGLLASFNTGGAGVGGLLAELAYVEVSDGGVDFLRFPATSLTPAAVGQYGSVDPTNVHNLAGKHVNSYGDSWGTPFDLAQVGLARITHIRLVDIPGNGHFLDQAGRPIYDAWLTFGSGGFDLDAVGSISSRITYEEWPQLEMLDPALRGPADDPDGDGLPNLLEYAFASLPWQADAARAAPRFRIAEGMAEFTFIRDERLTDLTYEVEFTENLEAAGWTPVARGSAGAPVVAIGGQALEITETAASGITGIGVIREVRIGQQIPAGGNGRRFFRVKVTCHE